MTWKKKRNDSNHLLLAAAAGARCAPGWPCPAACSSGMFAAAVTAFMTMRPRGIMYIHCKTTSQVEGEGRNILICRNRRKSQSEQISRAATHIFSPERFLRWFDHFTKSIVGF